MRQGPLVTGFLAWLLIAWMGDDAARTARGADDETVQASRLHRIGVAMFMYQAAHNRFPPAAICDKEGKPLLSWRVALLQHLGEKEKAMHGKFRLAEPWDSPYNIKALKHIPEVYQSPGRPIDGKTSTMVFSGPNTVFADEKGMSMDGIKDGPGNTILAVIAGPDKAVPWTKPEDLALGGDPSAALGEAPAAGILVIFCDGRVQRIRKNIDPKVLRALVTPAGGETIDENALR